jgi:hypothetical protein
MRLRDAAIALATTALMATPALAQQGNWNGNQSYQGTSAQPAYNQGYNGYNQGNNQSFQGTNQGWNQNPNSAAAGTNGELSQQTVEGVQQRLQQMGFYHGDIDGNWGPQTQSALQDYQQQHGMQATGQLDVQTLADLGLLGQQNRQFGSNQYGTQTGNGNQFGNNGGSVNGNTAPTNPNYQRQNAYSTGANWNGAGFGTSSSNWNSANNGMAGANGYNGSENNGANTAYNQGPNGSNANNGPLGYNNNSTNNTGTSTGSHQ